jgi:sigma-B regulation protein RsbU (phosphoserine phosphatase)
LPGLDAAALYRSASEVAQVGGDFYDLFALEGGPGRVRHRDVCGKGVEAGQAHRPAPLRAAHPARGGRPLAAR